MRGGSEWQGSGGQAANEAVVWRAGGEEGQHALHALEPYNTHLCRVVAKARDVNDWDHLKGHHPLVSHAILLTQLGLLLQVLFRSVSVEGV
jgi:hypothetical protein